ncbi:MAG TPA: hypothetical protein VLA09_01930, partial [Longimicrobiales bacterium]|nr:hypothetical protein [Longimicrobiales bacterium]
AFGPAIVVFSIVSDDVTRTGLRFFYRWKPYFSFDGGEPTLVPPPPPDVPLREPFWLTGLGYSHLARAISTRSYPSLWYRRVRNPAHRYEVEVSGLLLQRLQTFVHEHGGRLLVVLTAGGDGDARNMPALLAEAEKRGIDVLDLSEQLAEFAADPGERRRMFRPNYHLSPEGNDWMAARIEESLSELGGIEGS